MKDLLANSLLPFVPSGKITRRVATVRRAGFEERWESGRLRRISQPAGEFILQRFDDEHFAQNFWYGLTSTIWTGGGPYFPEDLGSYLSGRSVQWSDRPSVGTRSQFIDLAGVCWHIGQRE